MGTSEGEATKVIGGAPVVMERNVDPHKLGLIPSSVVSKPAKDVGLQSSAENILVIGNLGNEIGKS